MTMLEKLLALTTLLPAALAQSVTTTLSALVPLPISVVDGVLSDGGTLPAGPLPPYSNVQATVPGTANFASVDWSTTAGPVFASTVLIYQLTNNSGSPTFQAHAGPHEFLVEFAAGTRVPVTLTVSRQANLTPGVAFPLVQLDYDNDGSIDVASVPLGTLLEVAAQVGPQPLRVRVVVDASLAGPGQSMTVLAIAAMPRNDLLLSTPVLGCYQSVPPPRSVVVPTFAGQGVLLTVPQNPMEPSVIVIGFGVQPLLLSFVGTAPCLLLPSPDLVLFEPTGQLAIPLPASVRPVTFFVQGVTLTPLGLLTTDGFGVAAL